MKNGIAAYGAKLKTRDTDYNEILMYAKFKETVEIDLLASPTAISNKLTKGSNFPEARARYYIFLPFLLFNSATFDATAEWIFFYYFTTSGSFRLMYS